VVHRQQEDVFLAAQPQQAGPQQRARGQIERRPCLGRAQPPGLAGGGLCRQGRQVDDRQGHVPGGPDLLPWRAALLAEDRAQRLVTPHRPGQGRGQRLRQERPAQPHGERDVESRGPRLEAVEEPEALLAERQGERAVPRHRPERRRQRLSGGAQCLDADGQGAHGGSLEQLA
jgi:hypothetical protein